jgi:hypothetical protein
MENTGKFDVSVILPIKTIRTNNFEDYFNKCIESLKVQQLKINELVIVYGNDTTLTEYLNSFDFGDLNVKKYEWTEEAN